MRLFCMALAYCPLVLSGCSILVLECGHNLGETESREQVRLTFGEPNNQGNNDEYITHRKLGEYASSNRLGIAMTMGLYELYALPESLIITATKMINGQHLTFVYDDAGDVRQIYLNDKLYLDRSANQWYREPPRMLFPNSNENEALRDNFKLMGLGDSTIPSPSK